MAWRVRNCYRDISQGYVTILGTTRGACATSENGPVMRFVAGLPENFDRLRNEACAQNSLRQDSTLPTISRSASGVSSLLWFGLSEMIFTLVGFALRITCRRLTTMLPKVSRMA